MNKLQFALQKAEEFMRINDLTDFDTYALIKEALAQPQSDEYTEGYQQGYVEGWEAKKAEQPAQEPVDGYNLVEILNDPVGYYPHNFMTHAEGNALLRGLCQEAADEIERLRRLTQPAQEPVAWMYEREDKLGAFLSFNDKEPLRQPFKVTPLYTHPAPSCSCKDKK